jgi:hypothetical protein
MVLYFSVIIAIKIEADFYLVTFLKDARLLLCLWITRKKITYIGGGAMDQWRHCKENGNLSSAFEKAERQWKYIFESRHSRTKTIFKNHEKVPQKTLKIY